MFFHECERLAAEQPELQDLIGALDQRLVSFTVKTPIDPDLLAPFLKTSPDQVSRLLDMLVGSQLCKRDRMIRCEHCGTLTPEHEYDSAVETKETLRCSSCRHELKVSENDWSTVYFLNRAVENQATEHAAESGQIVVLIHGIRTHAAWQEMVAKVLRERKATVIPIRYGYFDVFRFLCPVLTRRGPIARVLRELRDIHSDNPSSNICVIAHSFGTYAVAKILADNTDVRLSRLVLCGSIVPTSYRWDRVKAQVSAEVINDCGTDDIWPVLATTATYGYGASGTVGFGTNRVRDRFHKYGHSGFFQREFVERFWVPYLLSGKVVDSEWETNRPSLSWCFSLLLAFRACFALPIALGAVAVYWYFIHR